MARGRSWFWANSRARLTSWAFAQRTISAGRRSNARLNTIRADSYSGSSGVITCPEIREAKCLITDGSATTPRSAPAPPARVSKSAEMGPPERAAAAQVACCRNPRLGVFPIVQLSLGCEAGAVNGGRRDCRQTASRRPGRRHRTVPTGSGAVGRGLAPRRQLSAMHPRDRGYPKGR